MANNILEFSRSWQRKDAGILISNTSGKLKIYDETNPTLAFFSELSERTWSFYTPDPTVIIPEFLKWVDKAGVSVEITTARTTVYNFSAKRGKKKLIIRNMIHLLGDDIDSIATKMGLSYAYLPYWSILLGDNNPHYGDFLREKFFELIAENSSADQLIDSNLKGAEQLLFYKNRAAELLCQNTITLSKIMKNVNKVLKDKDARWHTKASLPSISKNLFLSKYNFHDFKFNSDITRDQMVRESYFGGRCEIFGNPYTGSEQIFHMDFDNMYGELLKENFPTGDLIRKNHVDAIKESDFYFAEVISNLKLPVLPYKYENKGLIFPNGKFKGLYSGAELQLFKEMGGEILNIEFSLNFDGPEKKLFMDFSEELIRERKKINSYIWKKLLVSFYGRLGMKPIDTESKIIKKSDYSKLNHKLIINEVWIEDYCFTELEIENPTVVSRVEYASLITSKARILLYKTLKKVENEGGRLLYCDTDSVFAAYPSNFNKKKSAINWDDSQISDAVFGNIRAYSLLFKNKNTPRGKSKEKYSLTDWETKVAGIPRNSINFNEFKERFYSTNYMGKSWIQLFNYNENLKYYHNWNTPSSVGMLYLTKYEKREFSSDKKKTKTLYI